MTYTRIPPGHARLLKIAMDVDFPAVMERWKTELDQGRMTSEMREVFAALGYPVPRQSRRTQPIEPEDVLDEPSPTPDLEKLMDHPTDSG